MSDKTEKEVVRIRLGWDEYQALEKKMGNMIVTSSTSDIEAGYKLGVAAVLQHLRNGYVDETR